MLTRLAIAFVILAILSGCAGSSSVPTNSYCLIYEPVFTHEDDTEVTVMQVTRNNAAWLAICE